MLCAARKRGIPTPKKLHTALNRAMQFYRSGTFDPVSRDPQLPVQTGPPTGPAFHFSGQTRLDPVLLQGGPQRAQRPHTQEPASLHCHEPHRLESRATNFGCE